MIFSSLRLNGLRRLAGGAASPANAAPPLALRAYQQRVFWDDRKTLVLHWSRQIGKSFTLAAWAVDRLLRSPGRLVTVLSNSRENGCEFVLKVAEIGRALGQVVETENLGADLRCESSRLEARIVVGGRVGRVKALAANPRTARGFSGDLILDEFAFHEDSRAIWEAAEPIVSSQADFRCRIASTGNGRQNMFYRLLQDPRTARSVVRRSDCWAAGELQICSVLDGRPVTPDEARAEAADPRAYDQNYECAFEDERMPLLTEELLLAAERETGWSADRQCWSAATLARLAAAEGPLEAGWDIGRFHDLSVLCVLERTGERRRQVAELLMAGLRTPEQMDQARRLLRLRGLTRLEVDLTGLGLGLFEALEDEFGSAKVGGVNFAQTGPVSLRLQGDGRAAPRARITELMATELLALFERREIEIFADAELRDDLRKPEKIVSPGGRVSIASSRDRRGHADRFWAMALAVQAGRAEHEPGTFCRFGNLDLTAADRRFAPW